MRIKTDITALGELLIDFTPAGVSQQGMRLFEQNPGGAPANLLAAAAKFGRKTAFIGKVGKDMHGDFLKETLIRAGINTDNLIQDEKYFTTLAFVSLKENGEREFAFARKPGADTNLCMKEIDPEILENTRVFHVGSLSLTDDPSRTATYEAINIARNSGAVISYDPNYRAALWSDPETAQLRMQSLIPYVDMMKISDEETSLLTPYQDPEEAIQYLLRQGVHLVAVTLGRDGALIGNENGIIKARGLFLPVRSIQPALVIPSGRFSRLLSAGRNLAGTPDPGADDSVWQGRQRSGKPVRRTPRRNLGNSGDGGD